MRNLARTLPRLYSHRDNLLGTSQQWRLICSSRLTGQEEALAEAGPEYELETIHARTRSRAGRLAAKELRKIGRIPAILFSLPDEAQQLITLDKKETDHLIGVYGRSGIVSRLFSMEVMDQESGTTAAFQVLPKVVHRTAATGMIENITFLNCPPNRIVRVDVPIKVMGEDISPGVKKGGFVRMVRRRLKCLCLGSTVPPFIIADVSSLDVGEAIELETVELPLGVLMNEKHLEDPICKIAGKVGA